LDYLEEDNIVREYLLEAKNGLNRIAQFVRSLLDFCWSLSSQEREVDINRAVDEALFLFNYYFASYNIKVEKYFSCDLPRVASQGLKIAFNNIIKNACEVMKQSGGKLVVSTLIKDGSAEIKFTDTGGGISPEIRKKIFEPFFTTKSMGEGSGLGLAISQEIVQHYGGKILVESEERWGSTFIIQLPLNCSSQKRTK
jgi:signal transduction histidine kinase